MLRLTWKFIIARKERAALLILGVLIVSGAFGLLLGAVQTTKVTVTSDLSKYWRTTYDILVRPKGSHSQVEKDFGLVEANYLSNISGGITMQQYQQIKDIPGIEAAAPIAMLGYFRLAFYSPLTIDCQPGFYRLDDRIVTNDGQRDYALSGFEYFYCNPADGKFYHLFDPSYYTGNMLDFSPDFTIASWEKGVNPNDVPWYQADVYNIQVLLAAIDPEQESKLVGLDKAMVQGSYLNVLENGAPFQFPVIFNSRVYTTFNLQTAWKRLDLPYSQAALDQVKGDSGQDYLSGLPTETLQSWQYTSQEAYDAALKYLEAQNGQPHSQSLQLMPSGINYRKVASPPGSNTLAFEPIAYGSGIYPSVGNYVALRVPPVLGEGDPMSNWERVFRESSIGKGGGGFSVLMQGIYDIERLVQTSGPSEVPMETYYPPKANVLYDASGKPVDSVTMTPTLSDNGYLISPPLALTTLDAAPLLNFSNNQAPISAIRVRVAGIEGYSPEAKAKIEQIAAEIINVTDLDVDMVVGSSPQKVLVYIPGKDPIPPVGYVQEGWIRLGASYQIGSEVERINVILFAVMLLVSGLYILNTSMVSTLARQREIAIQKALGWKSSSVFTLVLSEGLMAGLVAGLLGLGLAVGLAAAFHLALPLSQALWIPPTSLALCLVGGLVPAVRAARIAPAQILARGEITASRLPTGRLSLPTYAWRQVWQRRSRSSLALLTIAVATALITLFLGITVYLHGYLSGTLLGETILTHIGSVQYLIAAISFLIAGFATADVLLMGVIERKREIGVLKATGWRDRLVFQLFLWEAAGLAASAGILGWLVGSFVLLVAFQVSVLAILGLLVPTLLIPVVVALGAALYPARQAARIPPSEAMRYE